MQSTFQNGSTLQERAACAQAALRSTDSRSEQEKQQAQSCDEASHEELRRLSRLAGECADCTAKFPGWAALPHGIFLCINCAQVHRNIGRHISQVKAINTGTYLWYEDEIQVMRTIGNMNSCLLLGHGAPPKLNETRSFEDALCFAKAKYEENRWAIPPEQHIQENFASSNNGTATIVSTSESSDDDFFNSFGI